ncbi:MAG: hypothetical protein V4646_04315 [Pseudomonadota bacterium]
MFEKSVDFATGGVRRYARRAMLAQALGLVLLAASPAFSPAFAAGDVSQAGSSVSANAPPQTGRTQGSPQKYANFGTESVSAEVTQVADWIVDSGDNQGMPFLMVDKVNAKVLMFDASGRLQGAAPALLGLARGDDSTPGIGKRKLSSILPEERTTPAGRFVSSLDRSTHGMEILWIDYDAGIALHRVVAGTATEKRAQRLDSATSADNRISYGCINVPVRFYEKIVSPAFTGTNGIVYILPETRTAREVFGAYPVPTSPSHESP